MTYCYTVLKDRPIRHKNMVSQDRWSLVTGSFTLKCVTCPKLVVLQDSRWSLMTVVSQDRFHCIVVLVVTVSSFRRAAEGLYMILVGLRVGGLDEAQ